MVDKLESVMKHFDLLQACSSHLKTFFCSDSTTPAGKKWDTVFCWNGGINETQVKFNTTAQEKSREHFIITVLL